MAGGKPSGWNVCFCQTQSPTVTKAAALSFNAKAISPFASSVARSGSFKRRPRDRDLAGLCPA